MFAADEPVVGVTSGQLALYTTGPAGLSRWAQVNGQPDVNTGPDSGIADLDCDGQDDLIIQVDDVDAPVPGSGIYIRGMLAVFYGPMGPGTRSIAAADAMIVDLSGEHFATSAAIGHDHDGDGCDDVVATGERGIFILPPTRSSGITDVGALPGLRRITSPTGALNLPVPVTLLGVADDLDGDGLPELVGTLFLTSGMWLLNGLPAADAELTALTARIDLNYTPYDMGATRDIDGDQIPDLAITRGTELRLFSGAAVRTAPGATTPATSAARLELPAQSGFLGGVAMIADVNGDRIAELAVGEPEHFQGPQPVGRVWLIPGQRGLTMPGPRPAPWVDTIDGGGASRNLGAIVFDVGDLDGDGRGDPIVTFGQQGPNGISGGFLMY